MRNTFITFFLVLFVVACNNQKKEAAKSNQPTPDATVSSKYKAEINELAKTADIANAFELIKKFDEQTIENQIRLTETPAPPFKENKFGKGDFFAGLLKKYGADSVWTDSVGNVIGLRKGTVGDKTLAVAGHLDTVFPEGTDVTVTQVNDTLYAPGIGDDNRGLAAVLTVLRTFDEAKIETKNDILFIGDVGEEGLGDLRGLKYLFRESGPAIDYFISIEPGGVSRITNGALGSHRYRVTIKGPGGHSWGSFGLANPAHALGQAIAIFTQKADEYTGEGIKTSYNVGRMGGGTSINSVPFSVWMEVDMRSLSQQRLNEIDSIFQESVKEGVKQQNEIRRFGQPLTVEIKMVGNRPSGYTNTDKPLVQRAMAASVYMGKEPNLRTSSTDSNIPISKGIPAITIGGGGVSGKSHSLHEWFLNKDGYKGIQRAFLIIAAQAEAIIDSPSSQN